MKSKAIFILCTFIVLFFTNNYSLYKNIRNQNDDISVVNTSGRQRMYSQKITKLALTYNDSDFESDTETESKLEEVVVIFSNKHKYLKDNFLLKYNNMYLEELFNDLDVFHEKIVTNTNQLIENKQDATKVKIHTNLIRFNSNKFLSIMDGIVNEYESIGKKRGDNILYREFIFNIILVLLSVYAVFFLIIPLLKSKDKNIR